jgi:hypothetical protein
MHNCPGPECDAQVPYEMLACRRHWFQVPMRIRNLVYAAWDRGAGAGSDEHTNAIEQAIAHMRPLG